jgi:hypothetical protein
MSEIQEIRELAIYLEGMAAAAHNEMHEATLSVASDWLKKLSRNVCSQGFIGCRGGENCESSHK